MNNTHAHQILVEEILLAVGSMPNIRLWKRVVGFDNARKIKYGIVGESDLQGIIFPTGRMLAIEVKTGSGVLSPSQKRWRDMVEKFGALYILARNLDDCLTPLRLLS